MSLEDDWERVTTTWKTVRDNHWDPALVLFVDIRELRKTDNKGIDFAIRRLKSSSYAPRIRLYGGPSGSFPRYPLRCFDSLVGIERHYISVGIPELQKIGETSQ